MPRDAETVLAKAKESLADAGQGLRDLMGDIPPRRRSGLRNVAVFGRSVTFVLQTLRAVDAERFDTWYEPWKAEMQKDPLLRYFVALRNTIEKEGGPDTSLSMQIEYLDTRDLQPLMDNPPPGASSFFVGDYVGGSGWEIELPDGRIEKFYVSLPEQVVAPYNLNLTDPPTEHLGQAIADTSAESLCALYVAYLSRLVDDAERHFST